MDDNPLSRPIVWLLQYIELQSVMVSIVDCVYFRDSFESSM